MLCPCSKPHSGCSLSSFPIPPYPSFLPIQPPTLTQLLVSKSHLLHTGPLLALLKPSCLQSWAPICSSGSPFLLPDLILVMFPSDSCTLYPHILTFLSRTHQNWHYIVKQFILVLCVPPRLEAPGCRESRLQICLVTHGLRVGQGLFFGALSQDGHCEVMGDKFLPCVPISCEMVPLGP